MKNFQPFFYILFFFLILSCQNKTASTDNAQPEKPIIKIEKMTYESATVYAASTDYFFKNEKGKTVKVRVSEVEENPKVSIPANFLETEVEEGPPGANPELVGKKVRVTYGTDNQIQKVRIDSKSQDILIEKGKSLAEIEALNGKPFMLVGFEVDGYIAGKVADWKGGKLTDRVVQFQVTNELPTEEYQQIMGDDLFPSDHPMMKKAALEVIFVD